MISPEDQRDFAKILDIVRRVAEAPGLPTQQQLSDANRALEYLSSYVKGLTLAEQNLRNLRKEAAY